MTPTADTATQPALPAPAVTPIQARHAVVVQDKGHSYFVDAATGEILHATRKLPKQRVVRFIDVDIGTDTRWPSETRDAEELIAATAPFDWWPDQHYINGSKFLDLLDAQVSANAVRLLRHIAENLTARNHWFGRMDDLAQVLRMPSRTLERALQELTAINAVKRQTGGKTWPTRISVHPWYAWKGDLLWRDPAYAAWLGVRPANFGGQ